MRVHAMLAVAVRLPAMAVGKRPIPTRSAAVRVMAMRMRPVARCVVMPHRAAMPVGAAVGEERFRHIKHLRAKPFEHRAQDLVALKQKARRFDLARGMAVADVPGKPRQIARHGHQRFLRRNNANLTPVRQDAYIAMPQADRLRQVEQE